MQRRSQDSHTIGWWRAVVEWDEYDQDIQDCTGGLEGCPVPEHDFGCYSMHATQRDRNKRNND